MKTTPIRPKQNNLIWIGVGILALAVILVSALLLAPPPTSTVPFTPDYIARNGTAKQISDKPSYQPETQQAVTSAGPIFGARNLTLITAGDVKPEGHTISINYLLPSGLADKDLALFALHSFKQTVPVLFRDVPTVQYLIVKGYCYLKAEDTDAVCITFRLPRASASGENWTTITAQQINRLASRTVEVHPVLQQAWATISGEK
jgi:hypothetical protein